MTDSNSVVESTTAFGGESRVKSVSSTYADPLARNALQMSFKDEQICFVVPAGAKIDAYTLDLPGGMVILGALRGKVTCATGSVIIAKGGEFQGVLEASDVYIEGKVTSLGTGQGADLSRIKARGRFAKADDDATTITGGIIAVGGSASVFAHMQARLFQVPRQADLKRSVMESI